MRSAVGNTAPDMQRVVNALYRCRFIVAAVLAASMYVIGVGTEAADDWPYFAWASDALFGEMRDFSIGTTFYVEGDEPAGLHLYANYGFIQIGPPALLVAAAIRMLPFDDDGLAGGVVIQLLGLLTVWLIDKACQPVTTKGRFTMAFGMASVTVMWSALALSMHLDDAMALTAVAGALFALRRSRWGASGLLLGLAAAAKPWAVVTAALVLVATESRQRLYAAISFISMAALFWVPFVLVDSGTLTLGRHHLASMASSPSSALGLAWTAGNGWLRPAQFGLAFAVAATLTLRGHWALGLLAGLATRLLLDPNHYAYYIAGLAVAALIADLESTHSPFPIFISLVTGFWVATLPLPDGPTAGLLNAICYGSVLMLAVLQSKSTPRLPRDSSLRSP